MSVGIVIVAHSPMASALYAGGEHCFQQQSDIFICDVLADDAPEGSRSAILDLIAKADSGSGVLVLTDMMGASPSNAAADAASKARLGGHAVVMLAGANTPMLLRAITYRHLALADMADRVLAGAQQAIVRVE